METITSMLNDTYLDGMKNVKAEQARKSMKNLTSMMEDASINDEYEIKGTESSHIGNTKGNNLKGTESTNTNKTNSMSTCACMKKLIKYRIAEDELKSMGVKLKTGTENKQVCECGAEIVDKKVTWRYLKGLREKKWNEVMKWETDNRDRILDSQEALPEQIQDYGAKMIIMGSDVVSLYPNLEIEKVVRNIKEAVMESRIKWEETDYQEGARYIALNWDKETCARSSLRRILPVRRGKRGTRPGMKGAGPRGKIHGDQEQ